MNAATQLQSINRTTWQSQSCELMTFTPEMAERILANHNTANRPMREAKAQALAESIKRGEWRVNGETIVFGTSGNVLTGQHRLKACVLSGIPISTWVVRGVDDQVFATLDQGSKKTAGDILAISGETSTNLLAGAARWVCVYFRGGKNSSSAPTPTEVQACVAEHPSLRVFASTVSNGGKVGRQVCTSPVVAAVALASEKYGHDAAMSFLMSLITGTDMRSGSPALLLRERLLGSSQSSKPMAYVVFVLAIKAISAHMTGRKMALVRFNPKEEFPSI